MADSTDPREKTEITEKPEKSQPAKKRRVTRKTTTKATAKNTPPETNSLAPGFAQNFDRNQLGDKTRVHALAKQLGLPSRELIIALDGLGLVKVAQSSLSRAEAEQLLDALGGPKSVAADATADTGTDPVADTSTAGDDEVPEEKIRTRVRKNVANEIHQIVEKVEADLAVAVEEHLGEEPLVDIEEVITPAPEAEREASLEQFIPLFRAPGTGASATEDSTEGSANDKDAGETSEELAASRRRRRGRRGSSRGRGAGEQPEEQPEELPEEKLAEQIMDPEVADPYEEVEDEDLPDEPTALKGSTRLEAQRRRRTELREEGRKKRHIVSQAEFLARRESVKRTMVVRERQRHDHPGLVTQVGVLEDDLLVEHFVTSEAQASMIGNIYLGRVQNVLPSMEAAFIDIGKGRNGVLYAGEVDWKSAGLGGRSRRIEHALRSGDQVLVQVSKDPMGHKGARLTTQISLAGRYLVYVPGGRSAGISRKLPAPERKRLKEVLSKVVPGHGGAIIRTAAENVSEEAIGADVNRLHSLWEDIQSRTEQEKKSKGTKPVTMYEEPNMLVKVIRDLFNEDFTALVIDGDRAWNTVHAYVKSVAPDLLDRVQKFQRSGADSVDAFTHHRIDEQIQKALSRKVWLPSGGSLVIDRTEAMIVVDVNTGKFTGSGGNLEETVTRNNLEAAEEIVRQMRLRDLGGMIVVDFIDMVLPENQDLVLRRLKEALGRDRTRHQVSEVTSLGLVQMTRKRLGTGLLETFSTECEHCSGRGLILHDDPIEEPHEHDIEPRGRADRSQRSAPPIKAVATERRVKPVRGSDAGVTSASQVDDSDSDLEQLAAAVVISEETVPTASTAPTAPTESRSRRSRRGRRSGTPSQVERAVAQASTASSDNSAAEIEKIVSAALSRAEAADPEEPSNADYVSAEYPDSHDLDDQVELAPTGEKSFQQAVAAFDASPRRRRRTRGNSKSDHRPRAQAVPADAGTRGAAGATEEKKEEKKEPVQRGRRRSTRSNRPQQVPNNAPEASEKKVEQTKEPVVRPNRPSTVSGAPDTTGTGRSRTRRRAVRRTTKPAGAENTAAVQQSQQRQQEQSAKKTVVDKQEATKRGGRPRRRVTRRSSTR